MYNMFLPMQKTIVTWLIMYNTTITGCLCLLVAYIFKGTGKVHGRNVTLQGQRYTQYTYKHHNIQYNHGWDNIIIMQRMSLRNVHDIVCQPGAAVSFDWLERNSISYCVLLFLSLSLSLFNRSIYLYPSFILSNWLIHFSITNR